MQEEYNKVKVFFFTNSTSLEKFSDIDFIEDQLLDMIDFEEATYMKNGKKFLNIIGWSPLENILKKGIFDINFIWDGRNWEKDDYFDMVKNTLKDLSKETNASNDCIIVHSSPSESAKEFIISTYNQHVFEGVHEKEGGKYYYDTFVVLNNNNLSYPDKYKKILTILGINQLKENIEIFLQEIQNNPNSRNYPAEFNQKKNLRLEIQELCNKYQNSVENHKKGKEVDEAYLDLYNFMQNKL